MPDRDSKTEPSNLAWPFCARIITIPTTGIAAPLGEHPVTRQGTWPARRREVTLKSPAWITHGERRETTRIDTPNPDRISLRSCWQQQLSVANQQDRQLSILTPRIAVRNESAGPPEPTMSTVRQREPSAQLRLR
jgi:hypothetical protein